MSRIADNLALLKRDIPDSVKLIAVSKTKPPEIVMEAYNAGHRVFGENRVQELIQKQTILPMDIEWHLIGHLQTNKVRFIVPFVEMIHSVDSMKLLREIEKEAAKVSRVIKVLLQVHIAKEETKFGMSEDDIQNFLDEYDPQFFQHVRISGLMGIATFTNDLEQVRSEYKGLKRFFDLISGIQKFKEQGFTELSMGMTGDYSVAIEEGSTLIRIGTLIFGKR